MISSQISLGYKCPNCGMSIDIGINTNQICPKCGTLMVSNSAGNSVSANVQCIKCNSSFRLINSEKCPKCGSSF